MLGALGLDDDGSGVMPHERTLPKAKSDRLELLRATRANLDPIWGLSLAGGLSSLLHPGDAEPDATAVDEEGFHHSLWRVDDPERIRAISDAVGAELVVLADGHHRFETANNYRRERRAAGIDDPGADAIMTLIVELAPNQLCVRAIHRLLSGVAGRWTCATRSAAPSSCTPRAPTSPTRSPPSRSRCATAAASASSTATVWRCSCRPPSSRNGWTTSRPSCATSTRPASTPACCPRCRACRSPTATTRQTVAAQVAKGNADAAVLLRPVSVETIRAAAAADLRMPEKTTFFAPKPRTGMVFRSLDG